MQTIEVIAGAQYGSEAKGHVTAQIIQRALLDDQQVVNIRVAGPNAGHTVYDSAGRKFAFRQIPVGAVLTDDIVAYIAPGSEVDPDVLFRELEELRRFGHNPYVAISGEATLMILEDGEQETADAIQARIGSTSKGIGEARVRRLRRKAQRIKDDSFMVDRLAESGVHIMEPHQLYTGDENPDKQTIVIEGTQGYGLGLHTESYPYVTSSDCRAIDFLAMAGLSPWQGDRIRVTLVARMFPIRVAGNSGPLEDETTWEALGLPEERTTVTQKVRRVGQWDDKLVKAAIRDNGGRFSGAVALAITMLDQRFPEEAGMHGQGMDQLNADARGWLISARARLGVPIRLVTTSPRDAVWIR